MKNRSSIFLVLAAIVAVLIGLLILLLKALPEPQIEPQPLASLSALQYANIQC